MIIFVKDNFNNNRILMITKLKLTRKKLIAINTSQLIIEAHS